MNWMKVTQTTIGFVSVDISNDLQRSSYSLKTMSSSSKSIWTETFLQNSSNFPCSSWGVIWIESEDRVWFRQYPAWIDAISSNYKLQYSSRPHFASFRVHNKKLYVLITFFIKQNKSKLLNKHYEDTSFVTAAIAQQMRQQDSTTGSQTRWVY